MRFSEGGIGLTDVLEMDMDDLDEWIAAAESLNDDIADAAKKGR